VHEMICPHLGKAFKIDEAGYADILKQVRDREFDKALHEQLDLAEKDLALTSRDNAIASSIPLIGIGRRLEWGSAAARRSSRPGRRPTCHH
jgi:hypothetical protein